MTYLDTHVVAALDKKELDLFSRRALEAIEQEDDLRISPMVLLELEYLHEIKRIRGPALDIITGLTSGIGLRICDRSFADVARQAMEERWTRDPFDRVIVAQARLGRAVLITRDRQMQARYPRAQG